MKRWLIFLMAVLLIACSTDAPEDASVIIELDTVDGLYVNEAVYVPVEALNRLNIDVLENNKVAYLSVLEAEDDVSNDRPYNWYIDQGDTGLHAGDNCGPSTSVMAAKWQREDFNRTPQEARGEFRSSGGWWFTDDIKDYFKRYDIVYDIEDYRDAYELIEVLNAGDIILLCMDTSYLTERDDPDSYIGKFYSYDGGHFLIVKGYTYVADELYYEVYDSNCWGEAYSDGSPKGKDRLYPADEIEESVLNWWEHYFIIKNL